MAVDKARTRRRQIAPLLGDGEQAVALVQVKLASGPGHGSNWLEGAPPPRIKPPPTRGEKVSHVIDVATSIASGTGWTSLQHGRGLPAVNSPFDVTAAGAKDSCAYRLVHATSAVRGLRDTLFCLVTARRLIFAVSRKISEPYEALFEVPLPAVAAVGRRSDCLVIEFTDASLVKLYVSGGLTASGEAKRLAGLLAPAGGREPQLGGYAPPWAAGSP